MFGFTHGRSLQKPFQLLHCLFRYLTIVTKRLRLLSNDCCQTITTSMYKTTEHVPSNASRLASRAKSLPALSNPVIFTAAYVEFHCQICESFTRRQPKSDVCHVMIPEALVPLSVRIELSPVDALLLTS